MTDEVIEAARLGAEWAWTAIYRELSPAVLAYVRANGGGSDAEDVVGEVFVQVVRKLPSFSGVAAEFRSWVFVIAHNRAIDHWRRQTRTPSFPATTDTLIAAGGAGNTEADALTLLSEEHLRSVLDRLSRDQRSVLLLRFIADLSIEETARVLGKRPGAVKALQLRALRTIRREISNGAVSL